MYNIHWNIITIPLLTAQAALLSVLGQSQGDTPNPSHPPSHLLYLTCVNPEDVVTSQASKPAISVDLMNTPRLALSFGDDTRFQWIFTVIYITMTPECGCTCG